MCEYTNHGHCGYIKKDEKSGEYLIDNDETLKLLTKEALSHAQAGVDIVAPSDMMDGRVAAIRTTLDSGGFDQTLIMSYSAKFHSNFYGPFRDAADSAPAAENKLTDRASYQLDPARSADALRCAQRDDAEGADILMVKPGLLYLDVLASLSARIAKPWAIYQTSGEQAAIDILANQRLLNPNSAQRETWQAFVRAGASMIISYAARRARKILNS